MPRLKPLSPFRLAIAGAMWPEISGHVVHNFGLPCCGFGLLWGTAASCVKMLGFVGKCFWLVCLEYSGCKCHPLRNTARWKNILEHFVVFSFYVGPAELAAKPHDSQLSSLGAGAPHWHGLTASRILAASHISYRGLGCIFLIGDWVARLQTAQGGSSREPDPLCGLAG